MRFTAPAALALAGLATLSAAQASTSSNPRIIVSSSTVTSVYTPVQTSTGVVYDTTSLPHSLATVTSNIVNTVTSQSVFTTNTLKAAAPTIPAGAGAGLVAAIALAAAAL